MEESPLGRLGPVEGRSRQVSVTLTGLSFRQTAGGRRYPYPDFGSEFIEALHAKLSAPRRRGLLRTSQVCPSCEASLEGIGPGPVTVTTELDLRRVPSIQVEVSMPGVICPSCQSRLVRIDDRSVDSDLSDALIDAFKAAGLAPT